jgi:hypothetical protein
MFDARMYMNIYWYVCKVSWYQKPAMIRVCSNSKGEPMFRAASGYGWNWWVRYHSINVFVEPPLLMTSPTLQNTYVYMYIYIYIFIYLYLHIYTYDMCTFKYIYTQIYISINMYIYICTYTGMYVYIYIHTFYISILNIICIRRYLYIYMQKPIHLSQQIS